MGGAAHPPSRRSGGAFGAAAPAAAGACGKAPGADATRGRRSSQEDRSLSLDPVRTGK